MTPDPSSRFAIIPVPDHRAAPEEAIVVGPMSEVFEYIPQSVARQDAVEELEKARFTADQISSLQNKTRAVQASMLADSVNHLSARLDAFLQRRADAAERARRDEEEAEQQRIADELAKLPDPDNPEAHGHIPGGDLHALPAKTEHDPEETEDDIGGVPLSYGNVPTSYVGRGPKDQVPAPGKPTEPEDPEDPPGEIIPQPTAVSLW